MYNPSVVLLQIHRVNKIYSYKDINKIKSLTINGVQS